MSFPELVSGKIANVAPNRPVPTRQPIVYRDEHLVVVDKPSGLAVHRSDRVRDEQVSMTLARDAIGTRVYPVHRLDRGTSGVLVYALDSATAARLQEQFQSGEVEKRYMALTRGVPADGRLDHPVPVARKSTDRADAATTFRVVGVGRLDGVPRSWGWVEARPHTGRFHQIRRHLKHLSCPLVGDVHYGKGDVNRLFRERFSLHRLALHARSIAFAHPTTGERITFDSDVPAELERVLEGLGLRGAEPPPSS